MKTEHGQRLPFELGTPDTALHHMGKERESSPRLKSIHGYGIGMEWWRDRGVRDACLDVVDSRSRQSIWKNH